MNYEHERKEKKAVYHGPRPLFPRENETAAVEFNEYLHNRDLNAEIARENGWYPALYEGAMRVVIPCTNSAAIPYFQARDMSGKATLRYASPPATRDDSIVLVWPPCSPKGTVILEGPMDALAAAGAGYLGIGLMGNKPPREVLEQVAWYAGRFPPVLVVPDADMLGMASEVVGWLSQYGLQATMRVPLVKDLASMTRIERRMFLCQ